MPETVPQIRPSFNRSVRIETRPERLSADAGALAQREMMDRTGIIHWLAERLHDPRNPSSIRHRLSDLLHTRLLLLGQGWRDQSDADRLRDDPSLRVASDSRRGTAPLEQEQGLASQPTLSRLLGTLSREDNLPVLHEAVTELACRRIEMMEGGRRIKGKNRKQRRKRTPRRKKRMFLDVDGLPVEVHGRQTGSEWSGYYRQTMYLGLVASCGETGDLIDGELYPGASYLGNKALKLTLRVVDRCRGRLCGSMIVRMDAGFPEPGLLEGLEKRGVPYIARIRKNKVLDQMAKPHLTQPAGRSSKEPPRVWFHEMTYQADSWDRERRVVLVVLERPGELYPDHFWLLTSLGRKRCEGEKLLATYRKRGKAEGHMGELMDVLDPALSSASRPKTHYRGQPLTRAKTTEARTETGVRPQNEALFLLNLLAYGILHLGRVLMEQATRRGWSLRRFQERVLRVASRVVCHGRRLIFVVSEAATDWRRLWRHLQRVSWVPG